VASGEPAAKNQSAVAGISKKVSAGSSFGQELDFYPITGLYQCHLTALWSRNAYERDAK
jgi:hypothetical protein